MSVTPPRPNDISHLRYLAEETDAGRVVLFVGAGVSAEAGLPRGGELAQKLAVEISHQVEWDESLGMVAEYFDRYFPGKIVQRLVKYLNVSGSDSISHQLIPLFNWAMIYTTNYDDLLEQAYAAADKPFSKILYHQQLAYSKIDETRIVKLHGCISPEYRYSLDAPIILTDRDYERFSSYREVLVGHLRQRLVEGYTLLFVGYGLQDPFWKQLREGVSQTLGDHTHLFYAVMPAFNLHREAYWKARHVQLIQMTAADFFRNLLNVQSS